MSSAQAPSWFEPGSVLARVAQDVFQNRRVIIVKSPPGAGKTTLISRVVAILAEHSEISVCVAGPTKLGMRDVASRLHAILGCHPDGRSVVGWGVTTLAGPDGVSVVRDDDDDFQVIVRTLASCERKPPEVDLLIVDEAYQAVAGKVVVAADRARQLLMVGDAGQIPPVIAHSTRFFTQSIAARRSAACRAPDYFEGFDSSIVSVYRLESSHRLGRETVALIQSLYDFPFDSRRPERMLVSPSGRQLAEIESIDVGECTDKDSPEVLELVATVAKERLGSRVVAEGADAGVVAEDDVAVVVSHNTQEELVKSYLHEMGVHGVLVGTADKLQGGQWHAVIALDPMVGQLEPAAHQVSPGRLCVMLSRHMTHLTWVHDDSWEGRMLAVPPELEDEATLGVELRRALVGDPDY